MVKKSKEERIEDANADVHSVQKQVLDYVDKYNIFQYVLDKMRANDKTDESRARTTSV